jgi:cytosine/adenosine deaminase-related metal-dependent hydrolase
MGGVGFLLKGGIVLTLDRSVGDLDHADVLIEDGKIKTVARILQPDGAQVIDCSGLIVMPTIWCPRRPRTLTKDARKDPGVFAATQAA